MSRKIIATYEMIKGYKNYPTNTCLALSEFIDNSIGSFQQNNPNNPIDGLIVTILFDNRNSKNKKIIISDNANGMSAEKMEEAMQPNDRRGKSDVQYNQYGVGMKLGIFWFGSDCTIWSKQKNFQENKLVFGASEKNDQDEVFVDAVESEDNKVKYSSGTTIEIYNVYDNEGKDFISRRGELDKLLDGLGWRYNKLIQKGLTIKVIVRTNEAKKNDDYLVKPYFNKPFNINQLINKNKNSNITKQQRVDYYNRKIQELYEKLTSNNSNPSNEIIDAYNKINNDEDVELTKTLVINGKEVELKYAIMDANRSNMARYSGVTLYHMDRAIMHGPNDLGKNNNFSFVERTGFSGGKARFRWLYGELNLTGIENPDENKSNFTWSGNSKQELQQQLEEIYEKLLPLLELISSIKEIDTNKPPNEKETKLISEQLTSKFSNISFLKKPEIICSSKNSDENAIKNSWDIFGEQYEIIISETNSIENFLEINADDRNKRLEIFIQAENKFWKPFVTNDKFKGELLYPLCIILAVSQWIYNNDEKLSEIDKNKTKDYSTIIDELIKRWI